VGAGSFAGLEHPSNEKDVKVPVNEDYLFDVDIKKRELGPVYWEGPMYEVKRGTWFYQGIWIERLDVEGMMAKTDGQRVGRATRI